jgi:hypothetical protein
MLRAGITVSISGGAPSLAPVTVAGGSHSAATTSMFSTRPVQRHRYSSGYPPYFVRVGAYPGRYCLPLLAKNRNCDKERFRDYKEYYDIMTGQIERSIVSLLDIDYNSLQIQNLARSYTEYDECSIDPLAAGRIKDISISTVIKDLKEMSESEQLKIVPLATTRRMRIATKNLYH